MPESTDDSSTSFHRQRRDLFVISAALIFAQLANIEIHKLSLLGTDLEIHNSIFVARAAWVLWGYWLVRYFQALNDLPSGTIAGKYLDLLPIRATAISRPDAIGETAKQISSKNAKGTWQPLPPQPIAHGGHSIGYNVRWTLQAGDVTGKTHAFAHEFNVNFNGRKLTLLKIRTFIYAVLWTQTFTEYFLPPVFALCPVIIWLYRSTS